MKRVITHQKINEYGMNKYSANLKISCIDINKPDICKFENK